MDTTELLGTLAFNEWGYLPPGAHPATWAEVAERFGVGARRGWLLEGLLRLLRDLRAAGVRDVWIDGSFVTEKPEPEDFDVCWSPSNVNKAALPVEFGYQQTQSVDATLPNHELLVRRYRGDVFVHLPPWADWVATFSRDTEGKPKGIVKMDMDSIT